MKINEIFYSLQGEGHFAGTPAVFVRFSGCNLTCGFCDTDHRRGEEWGEEAVVAEVLRHPARHVVLTGGEPALQVTALLVDKLHRAGCYNRGNPNIVRSFSNYKLFEGAGPERGTSYVGDPSFF